MTADANGSAINWSAALDQHARWLRTVLRSRVGDPHIVDDLFQEVSLAVWRQTSRPVEPGKVAPWLYRLAVRHSINHHRRNGRRRRLLEQLECNALAGQTRPADSLEWLIQDEVAEAVRQALETLPPREREMLVLKYTENWSYADLARHLGVSTGTVEYRLIRAKRNLRRALNAGMVASLTAY
jgi:RNA polymerase sigma-70 factor (ECF subfamily)